MRTAAASRAQEAKKIAIVTTDESVLPQVQQFLAPAFDVSFLRTREEIVAMVGAVEAVILDIDTIGGEGKTGVAVLRELRSAGDDLVIVALTRSRNRNIRLEASQAGADEFFTAPVDFRDLQLVIDRALDKRTAEIENRRLRDQIVRKYSFADLIGSSDAMQRIYDAVTRVAGSATSVIIRGESGTGKELVARAIVSNSDRGDKPFISLNCAALPDNLIETELFGHEKGAFTDAKEARAGYIELAHGGTLFLDEIGTLGLSLQSKLLRVLEERTVHRIGGKTGKQIDFRLITATNEDLEAMVKSGRFREDLYYRINVLPIHLPPLRERAGDIALLADHYLRVYCAANRIPLKRLDIEALEVLEEHSWPGNVRELENVIQRLVLMAEGPSIGVRHLPQQMLMSSTARHEQMLIPDEGIDFGDEMHRIEAAYINAALRRSGGKKVLAAALLRIDPQKMKYLCRKHRIEKSKGQKTTSDEVKN